MARSLAFMLLAALALPAPAAADPAYLAELRAAAEAQRLAEDPYWHRLLHYRPRLTGGVLSVVDTPEFFLSSDGKHDPQAELAATLDSFFSDAPRLGEPPQCRTRARYEWLKARLGFDPARLPPQPCALYGQWAAALDAAQLHLVFAANDLNSPATMYGHTLMRVDARGPNADQPLLSFAVSYAAAVAEGGDPLTYIAQGLAGGFLGEFSLYPYHEKVKQYGRINHRDLWEYPLSLSPAEAERMLWHLWELRGIGSDYYFLSENCSYMLLQLLETARPGLSLSAEFDDLAPYTIPVDTLRVLRDHGLLGPPVFRPSQARTLQHRLALLQPAQRDWVIAYGHGDAALDAPVLAASTPRDRARMLETAHDYLLFRFQKSGLAREAALPRARAVLLERSRLADKAEFPPVPVPQFSPEQGHESSRLDLGWRRGAGRDAAILRARGAYHDRLDPPAGYLPAGELEFFGAGVLVDDDGARVADFRLVNVQAVAPWSEGFRPLSWLVTTGARRYGLDALAADPEGRLGFFVDGGGGLAFAPVEPLFVYGFLLGMADANESVDEGYAVAGGVRLGAALQWTPGFTQQLEVEALDRLAGGAQEQFAIRAGAHIPLGARDGLRLALTQARLGDDTEAGAELRWLQYF